VFSCRPTILWQNRSSSWTNIHRKQISYQLQRILDCDPRLSTLCRIIAEGTTELRYSQSRNHTRAMVHPPRPCWEAHRPLSAETLQIIITATQIPHRHCWLNDFTDKRMLALGLSSTARMISRIRKKLRTSEATVKATGCLRQYRTLGATTREQSLRQIVSDRTRHDGRAAVTQRTDVCHMDVDCRDSEWPWRSQTHTRLADEDIDWPVKTAIFLSISQPSHADRIFTETIPSRCSLSASQNP
jgi:hypothetical protein